MEPNINQTQNPENQIITPVPTPPAKSPSKLLPILLAVLLILILTTAAYVFGKYSTGSKTPATRPIVTIPTVIPTPLLTTDPTTGWKTYENSKLHYSVEIPNSWDIQEEHSFIGSQGDGTFIPPSEINKKAFKTEIAITTDTTEPKRYSLNTQQQFNEWRAKTPATDVQRLAKVENLDIDNIDAVKFISTTLPGDATEQFFSIVTWFRKEGTNYYIEFGGDEKIVNENINSYNQILSTFKFIE